MFYRTSDSFFSEHETGTEEDMDGYSGQQSSAISVQSKEAISRQLGLILKSRSTPAVGDQESSTTSDAPKQQLSKADLKKKSKEEEKMEKRRQKEEEKIKRMTEKKKKKNCKSGGNSGPGLEDFIQNSSQLVPLFVEKCINFIEEEGLDSEGIYRVPGNRAHVDLLFQKFDEG